jgi:hypothetical protein
MLIVTTLNTCYLLYFARCELEETGSGLCPMVGCGASGVGPSISTTRWLVGWLVGCRSTYETEYKISEQTRENFNVKLKAEYETVP